MLIEAVWKLSPFDRLTYFIREREAVRLKKEAGEPPPWTDDEVIGNFRFTNVRRMDDRVSLWLLNEWYKPFKDHRNTLAAVALARFFNNPESLGRITGLVYRPADPDWDGIRRTLRAYKKTGATVFNAAYMVRGNDGADKIGSVVNENVKPLWVAYRKDPGLIDTASMERTHARVAAVYGYGSFMAGQIVADMRWALSGTWADRNEWAAIGPGSARGMNRLHGRDPKSPEAGRNWTTEFPAMMAGVRKAVPEIAARLEAIDFQNVLCESDKQNRVLFGEGRPKQIYRGGRSSG